MTASVPARKATLLLGIAGGLLACAAGVALAAAFLPEWRADETAAPALYGERYRNLATQAGFLLERGEPRIFLATGTRRPYDVFSSLDESGSSRRLAAQTAVQVAVLQGVRGPQSWPAGNLGIDLSFDGQPLRLSWWDRSRNPFELPRPGDAIRFAERVAPLLLHPGESFGPRRLDYFVSSPC